MPAQVFARGPLLVSVVTGPPNPGKILINPAFPNSSGGYEFLNVFKHAVMPWSQGAGSNTISPLDVDSNGYPTTLAGGTVSSNIYLPTTRPDGPNHYQITWTGNGVINPNVTLISGSFTGSGGFGSCIVDGSSGSIFFQITTVPVTNVVILHVNDVARYNAGFICGTEFTARIKQAQSPVLRSLNWIGPSTGGTNFCNITSWSTRKPATYASWVGDEIRANLYAGTTTNSNNDYSISPLGGYAPGSGAPVDKQYIHLTFNANQIDESASVTFTNGSPGVVNWATGTNLGGGIANGSALPTDLVVGAPVTFGGFNVFSVPSPIQLYTVYYVQSINSSAKTFTISATNGGAALTFSGSSGTVVCSRCCTLKIGSGAVIPILDNRMTIQWTTGANLNSTGCLSTFVYDADMNVWMAFNASTGASSGINSGIPIEIFIQMCIELGCHPWFCSPHLACDPMTDWHFQLATYCKNNCPSWMIPRFETMNEPFNVGQTAVADYGWAKAQVHWGSANVWDFVGKITSTIGQDMVNVYGQPTGTTYHLINNNRFGDPNTAFTSTAYLTQSAPAQGSTSWNPGGYTKRNPQDAASNYMTHISMNQYINSGNDPGAAATNWNAAAGNPTLQLSIIDTYLTGSLGIGDTAANNPDGVAGLNVNYVGQFAVANAMTNMAGKSIRLCGYEGGFYGDTGNITVENFFYDLKQRATNLQFWTTLNYQNFINAGGEFPACFQIDGPNAAILSNGANSGNPWSVLEDIYLTPDPPQWLTIVHFNH